MVSTALDPLALTIRTLVNGRERQNYRVDDMIFQPAKLVSRTPHHMTLTPGDVIACFSPPCPADEVRHHNRSRDRRHRHVCGTNIPERARCGPSDGLPFWLVKQLRFGNKEQSLEPLEEAMSAVTRVKRTSIPQIRDRKGKEPIVCLTAYTTQMARRLDPHVDLLLVGLIRRAWALYGFDSTLPVTLER